MAPQRSNSCEGGLIWLFFHLTTVVDQFLYWQMVYCELPCLCHWPLLWSVRGNYCISDQLKPHRIRERNFLEGEWNVMRQRKNRFWAGRPPLILSLVVIEYPSWSHRCSLRGRWHVAGYSTPLGSVNDLIGNVIVPSDPIWACTCFSWRWPAGI